MEQPTIDKWRRELETVISGADAYPAVSLTTHGLVPVRSASFDLAKAATYGASNSRSGSLGEAPGLPKPRRFARAGTAELWVDRGQCCAPSARAKKLRRSSAKAGRHRRMKMRVEKSNMLQIEFRDPDALSSAHRSTQIKSECCAHVLRLIHSFRRPLYIARTRPIIAERPPLLRRAVSPSRPRAVSAQRKKLPQRIVCTREGRHHVPLERGKSSGHRWE